MSSSQRRRLRSGQLRTLLQGPQLLRRSGLEHRPSGFIPSSPTPAITFTAEFTDPTASYSLVSQVSWLKADYFFVYFTKIRLQVAYPFIHSTIICREEDVWCVYMHACFWEHPKWAECSPHLLEAGRLGKQVESALAAMTESHRLGALNNEYLFCHSSGDGKGPCRAGFW